MAVHLESRPFHKPLTPAHWPPSDVLRLRGGGVPPAARAQAAGQSVRPRQPRFWLESLVGLFSFNSQGIEGSIILMLSHGLVSSALFLCVGILYDRHKTRLLKYYGGLVQVMPIFSILLLFFTFSNIGFPGTSSFVGELLVLMGVFQFSPISTFLSAFSMILGAGYSI